MASKPWWRLLLVALCLVPLGVRAEGLQLAAAAGAYDVDADDSERPHLNMESFSVSVALELWRFLAVEGEGFYVDFTEELDTFDTPTSFGARGAAVSARLQLPLEDDFTAYLRAGAAYFDIDADSLNEGEPMVSNSWQPLIGAGFRGRHWFAEYVYYGEIEDLHQEQLRVGLVIPF